LQKNGYEGDDLRQRHRAFEQGKKPEAYKENCKPGGCHHFERKLSYEELNNLKIQSPGLR